MGLAGAGNSGTVLALLLAPRLAEVYGWQKVYGFAAFAMLIPIAVMAIFAKEPPDRDEHSSFKEHISCLFEKDGWAFSLIYIVTFGGFIGLSNFLPTYFYEQFSVTKVQAADLTMLATIMGSALRIVGGYISDRVGGINTLTWVLIIIAICLALGPFIAVNKVAATLLFMLCFACLGAGNGALFQLVPLRWPIATAVAGSMIGEVGALGGSLIPMSMGLSKEHFKVFDYGFYSFAVITIIILIMMRVMQLRWTRTWADKGGRARNNLSNQSELEDLTSLSR
jgi:NNP family nitrate/nitrite transporter-like MFS transporter